jgi:glycoside/pentoside/hexuronide:cation symporter, GPH family
MSALSFREKAGYSAGEFGGSGLWQILMIFLPVFYTDVFGLPAAAVGTMLLAMRLIDAASDPIMGLIADRTRSRWGRFRPYLLWSAIPVGVAAFLLFAAPDLSPTGRLWYAYGSYIVVMFCFTVAMVPYAALSGVMTSDQQERTDLNSFRFVAAFGVALVVQALFQPSVRWLGAGDPVAGHRWTMAIYGGVIAIALGVAFGTTQERVQDRTEPSSGGVRRDLRALAHHPPGLILLAASLVTGTFIAIRSVSQIYYFKYAVENEALVTAFMVAGTSAVLAGILLTPRLTRGRDKRRLYVLGMTGFAVTSLAFRLVPPTEVAVLFALQMVGSFIGGPTVPLLWSMLADAADDLEWREGRRATGLMFAGTISVNKLGGALGGAVALFLLARKGYQANATQPPEVILGLQQLMGLYPAIGAGLCLLLLWFYPLDPGRLTQMARDLRSRRAPATPGDE